jgi:hypothetical protein
VELFGVPRTHRTTPTEDNLRALEEDDLMRECFGLTFRLLLSKTCAKMSEPLTKENEAWLAQAREELVASLTFAGPITKAELAREVFKASQELAIERVQIQDALSAADRVAGSGRAKNLGDSERRQALGESERLLEALRTLRRKVELVDSLLQRINPPSANMI